MVYSGNEVMQWSGLGMMRLRGVLSGIGGGMVWEQGYDLGMRLGGGVLWERGYAVVWSGNDEAKGCFVWNRGWYGLGTRL